MSKEEINVLSEPDFITYIICTVCDYAKANGYPITDTIKTMGKNLIDITKISTFDNWKGGDNH